MTGEKENTGNHQERESRPHTHTHGRETPMHDKIVPIHEHTKEHSPLIHSLSNNDWLGHHSAAKTPTMVEAAHLPHTEITGLQKSRDHSLRHDLFDQTKDAEHRLAAAHRLWSAYASEIIDKDSHGMIVHLHIAETKHGKDTDIEVLKIEGKISRPYLQGTIDATGKIIKATSAGPTAEPVSSSHPTAGHLADRFPLDHSVHQEHHATHVHTELTEQTAHFEHLVHAEFHAHSGHNLHRAHDESHVHNEHLGHHRHHAEQHSNASTVCRAISNDPTDFLPASADCGQPAIVAADINDRFQLARTQTGAASDHMIKLPDGAVYMRTHLRVDADGGSDWSTDSCGQAGTSLRNSNGQPLDAKHVNYFVLPIGEEWKRLGIKLGDIAWVRNAANGKIVPAIFGDEGPHNKIGEGSQGLCRALGLSDNPNHGGTDQKNIEFLIVPHSGTGKGDIARDPTQMVARLNNPPEASATA